MRLKKIASRERSTMLSDIQNRANLKFSDVSPEAIGSLCPKKYLVRLFLLGAHNQKMQRTKRCR